LSLTGGGPSGITSGNLIGGVKTPKSTHAAAATPRPTFPVTELRHNTPHKTPPPSSRKSVARTDLSLSTEPGSSVKNNIKKNIKAPSAQRAMENAPKFLDSKIIIYRYFSRQTLYQKTFGFIGVGMGCPLILRTLLVKSGGRILGDRPA